MSDKAVTLLALFWCHLVRISFGINRINWKIFFLNTSRHTSGISAAQMEYMPSRFIPSICLFTLFAFTLDDLRLFCQFECIHTNCRLYVEPALQIRSKSLLSLSQL